MAKTQPARVIPENWHMGLSRGSGRIYEDACPCPQESCGLVNVDRASPECQLHGVSQAANMLQGHFHYKCPRKRPV